MADGVIWKRIILRLCSFERKD